MRPHNRIDLPANEVMGLYRDGLSVAAIGRRFGFTGKPVRRILREAGVALRLHGARTRTDEEIRACLLRNYIETESGCWEWQASRSRKGYGTMGRDGKSVLAHRVSMEILGGQVPGELQVCHHCDNPPCINPRHLFVGTNADNVQDKMGKGRHVTNPLVGSNCPWATLDEPTVLSIYEMAWRDVSQEEVARRFRVSRSKVDKIKHGATWSHVTMHDPVRTQELKASKRKINADEIIEIYRAERVHGAATALAKRFGISSSMVGHIWSGRAHHKVTGHREATS